MEGDTKLGSKNSFGCGDKVQVLRNNKYRKWKEKTTMILRLTSNSKDKFWFGDVRF
jgi:hypothetical protein